MKKRNIKISLLVLILFVGLLLILNYFSNNDLNIVKQNVIRANVKEYQAPNLTENIPQIMVSFKENEMLSVTEDDLKELELNGYINYYQYDRVKDTRSFDLKYGEIINLYEIFPDFFSEDREGANFSIILDGRKISNYYFEVDGQAQAGLEYIFTYDTDIQTNTIIYPVPYPVIKNSSVIINNINNDGDLFPSTSERIKNSTLYDQQVSLKNHTTGQTQGITMKPNSSIDIIKEYPAFFHVGDVCEISVNLDYWNIEVDNLEFSGEYLGKYERSAVFLVEEGVSNKVDINSKIVVGSVKYEMQYEEEDPNGFTHAPDHYDIRLVLGQGGFTNYVSYYRLIEENDDNLKYVWVDTIKISSGESMPETPEGLVTCVRLNNNKTTEVLAPPALGVVWNINGISDFMPGGNNSIHYSSGTTQRFTSMSWVLKYKNEYDVKTFNKTDVEGNSVDACFEVSYDDFNHTERKSGDPTSERRKFIFNHYDTKVIKGETYENVYEVIGSTTMEDSSGKTEINTKDGNFTLYYPLYYATLNDYYSEMNSSTYEIDKLGLYYGRALEKIYVTETKTENNYLVNDEALELEIAENESYNSFNSVVVLDTEKNKTIVNNKKPTITKKIDENIEYDGDFAFNIYEKEKNELVATVKVKANEEVALEPVITDENENITGYLENGKTYIIREIPVENFQLDSIVGKHGEVKEDEKSKYFEFTFDASLQKLQDVVFYNKYIKNEKEIDKNEDVQEKKRENVKEEKKEIVQEEKIENEQEEKTEEKITSIKAGEVIFAHVAVLLITIQILIITVRKKRKIV